MAYVMDNSKDILKDLIFEGGIQRISKKRRSSKMALPFSSKSETPC
jgi:hypothetical protein